jgi:hypothetical protein
METNEVARMQDFKDEMPNLNELLPILHGKLMQ